MNAPGNVLSVRNLVTCFRTERGIFRAVDDVSFDVPAGGKVGIVGESGSGKTVTALSILGLVDEPAGFIERGEVLYQGEDLLKMKERELRTIRGDRIAMVFQEPMTALDPVFTVGDQIVETIRAHRSVSRREARKQAIDLLQRVGIPSPATRIDAWPHQLSGGMRQRVMIAIALCCEPALVIADEPTTALDVTVQAQVLELLDDARREAGTATLLISHDLAVVATFAELVSVMYAGQVVESGTVRDIFHRASHPYTVALLESLPPALDDRDLQPETKFQPRRLPTIEGRLPDRFALPAGCRFQARCRQVQDRCRTESPALRSVAEGHDTRCFFPRGTS